MGNEKDEDSCEFHLDRYKRKVHPGPNYLGFTFRVTVYQIDLHVRVQFDYVRDEYFGTSVRVVGEEHEEIPFVCGNLEVARLVRNAVAKCLHLRPKNVSGIIPEEPAKASTLPTDLLTAPKIVDLRY